MLTTTDGGLSFIISTQPPTSSPGSLGTNAGLVGRAKSTGVAIRFISATAKVQVGNTFGFPATNAATSALFPATDKHSHYFSVRYDNNQQLVTVYIDGILVLQQTFNMLDEGVLGTLSLSLSCSLDVIAAAPLLDVDVRGAPSQEVDRYLGFTPVSRPASLRASRKISSSTITFSSAPSRTSRSSLRPAPRIARPHKPPTVATNRSRVQRLALASLAARATFRSPCVLTTSASERARPTTPTATTTRSQTAARPTLPLIR